MNSDVLFEFKPDSNDQLYLWIGLGIAIVAFYLCYHYLRRPKKGREHTISMLVAMLFFFTGLMAIGTAFFSGWSSLKQGKVLIMEDQLQIGQDVIPYQDIKKVYYKKDKQGSIFQGAGGATTYTFLVFEVQGGATYALSEQQFPIGKIRSSLEEVLSKKK